MVTIISVVRIPMMVGVMVTVVPMSVMMPIIPMMVAVMMPVIPMMVAIVSEPNPYPDNRSYRIIVFVIA